MITYDLFTQVALVKAEELVVTSPLAKVEKPLIVKPVSTENLPFE